ncbi:S8 family serine peptidase [Maribellus sp. YY47]|uniref:S8 family serine peptidase n=1 Tax=Maribellus sp. YY47 TaxID=2929486 RepID=UPI0020012364|nr:S8 family serine peptidase [Maribellus sp. YY47]MCK3685704.1 S8 family serine peptidase [Maribellus sp. YY47]
MTRYLTLLFFLLTIGTQAFGQNYYWIAFSDKNETEYSLSSPGAYLSERAIQRRTQQNIPIDSLDLPVNKTYIDSVLTLDVTFVHSSKWLNGITVKTEIDSLDTLLLPWTFIIEVQKTKPAVITKSAADKFAEESFSEADPIDTSLYGASVHQVGMMEGQFLHNQGYKGEGLQIAVLDGGFESADTLPALDSLWANNQILGTRDFVDPQSDFFSTNYHGMSVLSCMGGNYSGKLIGTAPKASYWLLRAEDDDTEYIVEEDNWAAAAEFADSVGADIINSSLGYFMFDDPKTDHTYADMDGKTTRITRAANIAASRGMLVFASAGNERNDSWFRIIAPSDGTGVIGVGAVDQNLVPANFSSAGPAADGAIKPNLAAMGYRSIAQLRNGVIGQINGTSFSSPILAGMAACLWQRFPEKSALEIKDALEKSGSKYLSPDSLVGYGIPNMRLAAEILDPLSANIVETNKRWKVFPNPVSDFLVLEHSGTIHSSEIQLELYTIDGRLKKHWLYPATQRIVLNNWTAMEIGIYVLRISTASGTESVKVNKIR